MLGLLFFQNGDFLTESEALRSADRPTKRWAGKFEAMVDFSSVTASGQVQLCAAATARFDVYRIGGRSTSFLQGPDAVGTNTRKQPRILAGLLIA